MKKRFWLYILFFWCFSITLKSQDNQKWQLGIFVSNSQELTYKPYIEEFITFYMDKYGATRKDIKTPTMGLFSTYNFNANNSIRIRYGFSKLNLSSDGSWTPDTTTSATFNSEMKQSNQQVSIGLLHNIEIKPLTISFGFDLISNFYGKFELNYYQDYKTFSNGVTTYHMITETNHGINSGYGLGIVPFSGIYFNRNKFSFGFELRLPFEYNNFSKNDNEYAKATDVLNNQITESEATIDFYYKKTNMQKLNGGLYFSCHF